MIHWWWLLPVLVIGHTTGYTYYRRRVAHKLLDSVNRIDEMLKQLQALNDKQETL